MKPENRDAAHLWDMLEAARIARELLDGKSLDAHPEIDWRGIVGQRNVLAHEYGVIDHARLYRTGTESVPLLIAALEKILEES